jgi:signal peptidase I
MFDAVLLLLIGALFAGTWLARWHVILTGSMAPTYFGTHCDVACSDCGFHWAVDAERPLKLGQRIVCPNCDYSEELKEAQGRSGDQVLVARSIYSVRDPERWETAASRLPEDLRKFGVKRIVGLPGENILLRQGDVYINGYLARKNLAQQQAMAILVNDADFKPGNQSHATPRWQREATSGWAREQHTYVHRGDREGTDWLVYHHERRQGIPPGQLVEGPVTDRYGYNQTWPVRDLFPMLDVMLTCRVRASEGATWRVRASDRTTELVATFDGATGRFELREGFRMLGSRGFKLSGASEHALVVSLIDRRYEIAVDGQSLFQFDLDLSPNDLLPSPRPFAIGALLGELEVSDLRVWRDVYYTAPPELAVPAGRKLGRALFEPYALGPDEYFLLGDNSPRSLDSRYRSFGKVHASLLIGKPVWRLR